MSSPARPDEPSASPIPGFPGPIDGLDIASGLRRMEGDPELYLALLRDFVATERNAATVIADALAADDWPAATRCAHTAQRKTS